MKENYYPTDNEDLIVDVCAHYRDATISRGTSTSLKGRGEESIENEDRYNNISGQFQSLSYTKVLTAYEKEHGVRGMNMRTQFLDSTYVGEVPVGINPWDRSRDEDMFKGEYSAESKDGNGHEQKSEMGCAVQSYPIPLQDLYPSKGVIGSESKGSGINSEVKGGLDSKEAPVEGKSAETEMKGEEKSSQYENYSTPSTRDYK